eukprot:gene9826-2148_t
MHTKKELKNEILPKESLDNLIQTINELKAEGHTVKDKTYKNLCLILKTQLELIQQKEKEELKKFQEIKANITKQQNLQLRSQIYTVLFHLNQNVTIPPCLLKALSGKNVEINLNEYEIMNKEKIKEFDKQNSNFVVTKYEELKKYAYEGRLTTLNKLYNKEPKQQDLQNKFHNLKKNLIISNQGGAVRKTTVDATIKMKSLQLLEFQKLLKRKVMSERIGLYDVNTFQFEQERRQQEHKKRRTELNLDSQLWDYRKKFLFEIENHRKNLLNRFEVQTNLRKKLCKEVIFYFENKIKIQREKKEIQDKARLKALKENDSEAYLKLLMSAKEDRLMQLLQQTDDCLKSLGAQLVQERNKNQPIVVQMNETEKVIDNKNTLVEKYLENEHAYYTIAHNISESITTQPSMLKGGNLKEYQIQGLQWMVSLYNNHLNGILADELGLGKTIQTISLIVHLMEYKNNPGPFMVIAPLSTLDNWLIEFQKWAPHIKVIKYVGNQETRRQIQVDIRKKNFNVLLIQYEYVSRDVNILRRTPYEYIIIDEGHRIKNKDAKLVADLKLYNSKYRLLLTGTPLQNDLTELWALLNFLLPHVFDKVTTFETWFNTPFQGDKVQMTGEETLLIIHRLHQVLRPFLLRREKKDVESQLPQKVEKIIRCPLSAMQRTLYDQIQNKSKSLKTIKGKVKRVSLTNTVMQLRKVCNHPFLFLHEFDEFTDKDLIRTSGKFELLDRILPKLFANNHRILLFSQMTKLLNVLEIFLGNKKIDYLRLDGNVKSELRVANEKRDAEKKVIKAGMFDQRSTYTQRSEMLKSIMDGGDAAFEAEIPNDEQLNKIIARGDEEENLFNKMDKERENYEIEYWKKLKLPRQGRLMTEDELPEWLKNMDENLEIEEDKPLGKGFRTKKSLNYDLLISDEEMFDLAESEDEIEENLDEIDEDYAE